jgi:hypothetical protein
MARAGMPLTFNYETTDSSVYCLQSRLHVLYFGSECHHLPSELLSMGVDPCVFTVQLLKMSAGLGLGLSGVASLDARLRTAAAYGGGSSAASCR